MRFSDVILASEKLRASHGKVAQDTNVFGSRMQLSHNILPQHDDAKTIVRAIKTLFSFVN
jgi:hypothetical protein